MKLSPFIALAVLTWSFVAGSWANVKPKWEPIMTNDQGLFYIDSNSVTQEDGRKTVQSVLDYKKPQTTSKGKNYLSLQSQVEVDCKKKMARVLHMTYFSGAMLTGQTVYRQGMLHEWMAIDPSSPIHKIARKVC